jgi:hypothetical protein
MTNIEQHHDIVKKSLSLFIKKNIPGANLKNVDAIVLEYVISILEEASQDESFDVEGEKGKGEVEKSKFHGCFPLQHSKK